MVDRTPSRMSRLGQTLGRLSPPLLALVGVLVMVGVGGGGYYAYRTYDYVQHDNDFCMSCHLMAEPFEAFAQSDHQGLGCKACHRPNLLQRSQMGLTAVVDDPDAISTHAQVPNEVCAECHVQGDPEKWRLIANSAGHRVHLESDDPALDGLRCVECHSTSIHEFAPIDRTCSQSGCHDDAVIQLGEMGNLTIHCAACHTFVAPPAQQPNLLGSELDAAFLPDQEECLSCHVMRTLVELPDPDPHGGGCAACHNPHTQSDPSQAAESCATAGCHESPRSLTSFHAGLETDVLTDCVACHRAHDFSLDGSDCASCHEGMAVVDPVQAVLDFTHDDHELVECASCHTSTAGHGLVSIATVEDCRSCHHTEPVSRSCERCHEPSDAPDESFRTTRSVSYSVGTEDPARTLTFPHPQHADIDCGRCHTQGLALEPPASLDCVGCHEDHHTAESDCASCHRVAPVAAHPPSQAHITCSGASCHENVPFATIPRTRAFCLGCHQDLRQHEAPRACAECHTLPAPLPQR
jgi:nitrate/TMAO reductase-like tetraheme cytochrome c subunit